MNAEGEKAPKRKPGRRPGAKSVGLALTHAARLHRARTGEKLHALGLFAGQEQVLQVLAAGGPIGMGDLATLLRVRPPTASKTVSRLSALGLVERRAERGDGRAVRVGLTEAGEARAAEIARLGREVEAEALRGLGAKNRKRLRRLLRAVAHNLADASESIGSDADSGDDAGTGEVRDA